MRTVETLLEEYRKGDFHKRLNLYVQYRDLRRKFMEIDSDEPQAVSEKIETMSCCRVSIGLNCGSRHVPEKEESSP